MFRIFFSTKKGSRVGRDPLFWPYAPVLPLGHRVWNYLAGNLQANVFRSEIRLMVVKRTIPWLSIYLHDIPLDSVAIFHYFYVCFLKKKFLYIKAYKFYFYVVRSFITFDFYCCEVDRDIDGDCVLGIKKYTYSFSSYFTGESLAVGFAMLGINHFLH